MVEPDLRHRIALIEEQVAELKTALDDMRAKQRLAGDGSGPHTTGFVWKGLMVMDALSAMRR
jgi:hypothetical protein